MIVFIIPFISKKVSSNWKLSCDLLQGTLDSLANQSDTNFRVIVSCHEIPEVYLKVEKKHVEFLQMDYLPDDDFFRGKSQRDRWWKCCAGLRSLSGFDFKYCMALDADDRVHRDMTAFLNQQNGVDVWVINKGYQVDYVSLRLLKYKKLNKICGSTVILSPQAARVPQQSIPYDLIECFWCACSHSEVGEYSKSNNFILQELPFYGVQYLLNHSVNDSNIWRGSLKEDLKFFLKFSVIGQKMSEQVKEEFGYFS